MSLKVFYDGLCKVCSHEINLYKSLDKHNVIEFVDICAPGFSPEIEGLDPKLVHKLFHVKTHDGRVLSGVEAFVEIWKILPQHFPLKVLQKMAQVSATRMLLNMGYKFFVQVRPYFPRYKADIKYCAESPFCEIPKKS